MTAAAPDAVLPLSLYVHFPWCVSKCPYCDFNSYALRESLPEERYVSALVRDLERQAPGVAGRTVSSIFLGGGTPSLFGAEAIARLLAAARRQLDISADAEITLEANPGAVERGRFSEYRAIGVNRISLGAQTFDSRRLAALGRIHSAADTQRAAEELHAAGIDNFNLDLMYSLPGQDAAGAVDDLRQALALGPVHVSHYELTIEAGTPFAAHPPPQPQDDESTEMLAACGQLLSDSGYARYEVSAYARPDWRCRHNLNYWGFGDYLGIGAGAHGKLSRASSLQTAPLSVVRTVNLREPRRYMAASPTALTETEVGVQELPFEFMLNALRLVDGFETSSFRERTGLEWQTVAAPVDRLIRRGLLACEGGRCRPTIPGMQFLNDVLLPFLAEKTDATRFSALSTAV